MNRRDFLRTSSAAAVFAALPFISDHKALATLDPVREGTLALPASNDVQLGGIFGKMYESGLRRLTENPLNTDFVLADVNFNQKRWFTNFSGDISGRFLEVCSCSKDGKCANGHALPSPEFLEEVVDRIVTHQKPDGHFGADVDWWEAADLTQETDNAKSMPILWGNGRLLLGLVAAYETFHKDATLAAAKKLGDFYVNTVEPRFCDPKRMDEYSIVSPGYASAYVTCVYEGMEGLVQLYRATKDRKYLDCVRKMADFHERFDVLPVRHSHGSLSEHEGLIMLYEETHDPKYLARVEKRWDAAVSGGFVNVCGSVLEKFFVVDSRDEGCSEADWLRLNFMLWRNTGNDRYLDMAERLLYNGYIANQWVTGGFGHRFIGNDEKGPFSYKNYSQESLWCCSYHCPMGLYDFKRYLVVAKDGGIRMNFGKIFTAPVEVNGQKWVVKSEMKDGKFFVTLDGPAGASVPFEIRKPFWATGVSVSADLSRPVAAGTTLVVKYEHGLRLEDRLLRPLPMPKAGETIPECAVMDGAKVLISKEGDGGKIDDVTLTLEDGCLTDEENALTTFKDLYSNEAERVKGHSFLHNVTVK